VTPTGWALVALVFWVTPAVIGFRLGERKNLPVGLALGLLFSWFGILALLLLPNRGPRCPGCAEHVRPEATVCRYCGTRLIDESPGAFPTTR
jgi:hypothetical protein